MIDYEAFKQAWGAYRQNFFMHPDTWKHPTGRDPKRVAILGLGPTAQDWHTAHVKYVPPLAPVDEVWVINKGMRTVNADLAFIMDDLIEETRQSERYGAEIQAASQVMPIITSQVDSDVRGLFPNVHQYPLPQVLAFWGRHLLKVQGVEDADLDAGYQKGLRECSYMHNSVPYILAYAGAIGVRNVVLFGIDYTFPGAPGREEDRANAEWWLSALQFGLGVTVQLPERTTLLNRNQGVHWYGFNGRQPF